MWAVKFDLDRINLEVSISMNHSLESPRENCDFLFFEYWTSYHSNYKHLENERISAKRSGLKNRFLKRNL